MPSSSRKITQSLELIQIDISGPLEPSLEGYCGEVVVVGEFTAASFLKILKKSELSLALIEFKHRAEFELQMYGTKLTNVRLDRAGENLHCAVTMISILNLLLHMQLKATAVL